MTLQEVHEASANQKSYSSTNEEIPRGIQKIPTKPTQKIRWLVLFLVTLPTIGKYYCYNNPAALKPQIHDHFHDIKDYEFWYNSLYSVYSFSNIVLPFFGGFFCDRFGAILCTIVYSSLGCIGQLIVAFGSSIHSFPVMLIGRSIFGFGAESLYIGQSIILGEWFIGKQLAFVYAINLCIGRFSAVFNNIFSPRIAFSSGVTAAFFVGAITCAVGVAAVLIIRLIDQTATRNIREKKLQNKRYRAINGNEQQRRLTSFDQIEAKMSNIKGFGKLFWLLTACGFFGYSASYPFNSIASTLLLERDYFKQNPIGCELENPYACQSSTNLPTGNCPSSEWYAPPIPYNYTAPSGEVFEPLTVSDINCQSHLFKYGCLSEYCTRHSNSITEATTVMSIPFFVSAVLFPILGFTIDKIGCKALLVTASLALSSLVHCFLAYSSVSPIGLLIFFGISDSVLAAALWPAIPFSVDNKNTGLAFGVVLALLNVFLTTTPVLVATVYSLSAGQYIPNVETCFVIFSSFGVFCGILLNYFDFKEGSILNRVLVIPPAKLSYSTVDIEMIHKPSM